VFAECVQGLTFRRRAPGEFGPSRAANVPHDKRIEKPTENSPPLKNGKTVKKFMRPSNSFLKSPLAPPFDSTQGMLFQRGEPKSGLFLNG
jgi:hypothetical protein